ncbi:MAG TPA: rod shape-determining protein RodA [Actinomycetota bacterium]
MDYGAQHARGRWSRLFRPRVSRIGRQRVGRHGLPASAALRHVDPVLVLTALALTAIGAVMIYSASFARLRDEGFTNQFLLNRQLLFAGIGVLAGGIAAAIPYRRLRTWAGALYGVGVVLLVAVLSGLGDSSLGAQRWIDLGPLQLQPSEIMKVGVIVTLAALLAQARGTPGGLDVLRAILIVALPAALIFKQPDLGTLLVLLALLFGALLVAGTRVRAMLALLTLGVAAVWGVLHVGVLEDYQVARLRAFLDSSADPQVTGYNLNQAKIAVGSGGLTGKGLFQGTQTNLDFVPEQHTDFIFTAVGEETGFVGSAVLLALFALLLWRGVRIAMLSKDLFGTLLAAGVVSMITFQVFVNIGMTIGLSPITGIPLPFVSYGGSSLLTNFIATGILLNVHMRRI